MGVDVVHCATMEDFCLKALEGNFDVALIDYNLGHWKGDDVARVIDAKPTFLISGAELLSQHSGRWPNGIRGFLSKKTAPQQLLAQSIAGI